MHFQAFSEQVTAGGTVVGCRPDLTAVDGLYGYFTELRRWGAKVNLISKEMADEELVDKHFVDSLALAGVLGDPGAALLDVGSGAGFPGLVCKLVEPRRLVRLMEPRLKRVSFLRQVIRAQGLDKIDVLACRLEPGTPVAGETAYRWVVSRAVTSIGDFLSRCSSLRRPDCRIVCMKGPRYQEELAAVAALPEPWRLERRHEYRLPVSGAERVLLVFRAVE
jgi:16S rRNA (guanine527-N7)-methyltransferase